MDFTNSIKNCLQKYAIFTGRASRTEFWYFILFYYLVTGITYLIYKSYINSSTTYDLDFLIFVLGISVVSLTIPYLAVTARRLHDINKSGWWQLIGYIYYIGIIGIIVLIFWWASEGDKKNNRFGKSIYKKKKRKK